MLEGFSSLDLKVTEKSILLKGKVLSDLDVFVLKFIRLLEKYCSYVIVSGYVCILFGRSRGTEDVDIILGRMTNVEFLRFYDAVVKQGYYFINPEDA